MLKAILTVFFTVQLSCSLFAQTPDSLKTYIFGNSTIDHALQVNPTPSDETTVPHWMYQLCVAADTAYTATGIYGFPPGFASNLPPFAQWGYDSLAPAWDSDNEPFSAANFDNVWLTTENFVQYQPPHFNYYGMTTSPLQATIDVFDWVKTEEDSARLYVYENWPDMAPYLSNGFPPNPNEFAVYNDYTKTGFHDWWVEFQDSINQQRPLDSIKFIPVGKIISELVTDTLLNQIPITELYEDDAPHGRANIYFLAAMVCYSAITERMAPLNYVPPSIIDPIIINSYPEIANRIWTQLLEFNYPSGESRVFFETDLYRLTDVYLQNDSISIYPNPDTSFYQIKGSTDLFDIDIIDASDNIIQNRNTDIDLLIDIDALPAGPLYIRIRHKVDTSVEFQTRIKD